MPCKQSSMAGCNRETEEGDAKSSPNSHLSCCMHIEEGSSETLDTITRVRWETFRVAAKQWLKFGGREAAAVQWIRTDLDKGFDDLEPKPRCHFSCYRKLTNKKGLSQAAKKYEKAEEQGSPAEEEPSTSCALPKIQGPSPKKLRSVSGFGISKSPVLPAICIICKKKDRYIKVQNKRTRDRLSMAETLDGGSLREVAERKKDENILMHIRDKDCVAIGVRYHHSCYKEYIRPVKGDTAQAVTVERQPYTKSYQLFCKEVVQEKIIEGQEVFRMTKLLQYFKKYVMKYESADASTYRSNQLKARLMKDFPQLSFHTPLSRSSSTLVYVETLEVGSIAERLPSSSEAMTSSETDTTSSPERRPPRHFSGENLKTLYSAGLIVNSCLKEKPGMECEWPPTSESFDVQNAAEVVPVELFNLLAWIVGATHEATMERVDISDDVNTKLLSICQDIVYLTASGRKQTPKSLALGLTVRHLTGSSRLVTLLNKFGHCVSSNTVLGLETSLAQLQLSSGSSIPTGFSKQVSTIMVWDNIDFGEETLTGAGTTHHTNGIMIQASKSASVTVRGLKIKKNPRSLKTQPEAPFQQYYLHHKQGPQNIGHDVDIAVDMYRRQVMPSLITDFVYIITKYAEKESEVYRLPGWTGFNKMTGQGPALPQSAIHYLPVIEASPSDMTTVNRILTKSVEMADRLELQHMVLVFDQAIYAKAQQIRWKDEQLTQRLVIRLGEFHTCMAFLGILGKRFSEGGLQDILIESQVVAQGSINGVISGHHYNRSLRVHKLLFEALHRLRFQSFLDSLPVDQMQLYQTQLLNFADLYPTDTHLLGQSPEVSSMFQRYNTYIQERMENPTFAFWTSYLDMVQLLLVFLRATRESNWYLHLAAIRLMLPWYFAYDRVNYARYLPVYWMEMSALPETHGECHRELSEKGSWTVQRQDGNMFASIACDQAIEQTVNRDSKTKGGVIGKTISHGAVQRWILSQPERSAIVRECENLAGLSETVGTSKDLGKNRMQVDEEAVHSIMSTVQDMVNPFDQIHDGLMCLSSGVLASQNVKTDMLTAEEKGEAAAQEYMKSRLIEKSVDVFLPIKAMKLKTFGHDKKVKTTRTKSGKEVMLQQDRNLFARLLVIGQTRNLDLHDILSYSLGPTSYPLSSSDGSLAKTAKSALLDVVEAKSGKCLVEDSVPAGGALLIDGMALLQALHSVPDTFSGLADLVLQHLFTLARQHSCTRVDFVTDLYPVVSIKNMERSRRAEGGVQVLRIYGKDQKTPTQWKKFLSSGENKENLIHFFYSSWSEVDFKNAALDLDIYVTHGEDCHLLSIVDKRCTVAKVNELSCDHEEADTRLLLHAKHASATYSTIVIKSPDTDVAMIALCHLPIITADLFFWTGVKNKTRIINLQVVESALTPATCKGLLGLHVFTGCDSTSAFFGKGKRKAFDIYYGNSDYIQAFSCLGADFEVKESTSKVLERFVCDLYNQKEAGGVNEARYNIFCLSTTSEQSMPPTLDALNLHINRANYQAKIHRSATMQWIKPPHPNGHGWEMRNNELEVKWMTQDAAPESVLLSISCKCKASKCESKRCSCRGYKLACTDVCGCKRCTNKPERERVASGSEDEDDSDSD